MTRPIRIEFSGAFHHVTSRGDRRENIYEDDEDRVQFLGVLKRVVEDFNWVCHAYCLMTNHYHLVIETPDANLSKGMRQLNGVYTQTSNRRHGRTGHLFQGRYKAILVDGESYLLELTRYVVLNPVRAGMVPSPGDWVWSSYRAMTGEAPAPSWLATDGLLAQFSTHRNTAIKRYREFVTQGIDQESIWREPGVTKENLGCPFYNIEFGVILLARIQARIEQPTIAKIATIYNFLGAEKVNDYGARVAKLYITRPWTKEGCMR